MVEAGYWNFLQTRKRLSPGRIFLRSTSLPYNILPTNLGARKPTFCTIYTSHLRWNSTMRHCFSHTDLGQYAVFTILQYKLHSFNIQEDQSKRGHLAKPLKKISKITYTASRFSLLRCELWSSVWMNINRVTLQHDKEYIMFIFYLMVLSMCNLQAFDTRGIFSTPAGDVHRLKTNGTAIQERLLTINKRNIILWNETTIFIHKDKY